MREFLVFWLYGPMASWGDIAVGERRPSIAQPSRSAILGLIAAALGIKRDEEERHAELSDSYATAFRVTSPGTLLQDYHTAQVPEAKRGVKFYTRREELAAEKVGTVLSSRDYYCDAFSTACVWTKNEAAAYSLSELKARLTNPVFTLYLGRKSCPLALPLDPQLVSAITIKEAFELSKFRGDQLLPEFDKGNIFHYYWEEPADPDLSGLVVTHTNTRRDTPISRTRWQFMNRQEHYTSVRNNKEE